MIEDVVICIPTYRYPPVQTLEVYAPGRFSYIIVCDPKVYEEHQQYYGWRNGAKVVVGGVGMQAQAAECYRQAALAGYPWFFRLDDDLKPRTFIYKGGGYASLEEAIAATRECVRVTRTTLAGFANTTNRSWLGQGYSRSWGLIHGGACITCSTMEPAQFMGDQPCGADDVYRSCAHRERDGAVGRVNFIGFDKHGSVNVPPPEVVERDKKLILSRFPGMVTCEGYRAIEGGKRMIPNWRMQKHAGYHA